MTIQQLKNEIKTILTDNYTAKAIQTISNALLEKHLNLQTIEIILNDNQILESSVIQNIQHDLNQILQGKPYQYVIGYTWFYDLKIKVNPTVLIPRPETEELVHWIVECNKKLDTLDIIDVGTGSGCIALALKSQLKNAALTGVDISPGALKTARKNASINKLNVHFELFDVLNYLPNWQTALFDVVVSNPPYIPIKEKIEMDEIVIAHEPSIALFTPNDNPLIFYEQICRYAKQYLKPAGQLYFEMHEQYHEEVKNVMLKFGFELITVKKDLQGKIRMIRGNL